MRSCARRLSARNNKMAKNGPKQTRAGRKGLSMRSPRWRPSSGPATVTAASCGLGAQPSPWCHSQFELRNFEPDAQHVSVLGDYRTLTAALTSMNRRLGLPDAPPKSSALASKEKPKEPDGVRNLPLMINPARGAARVPRRESVRNKPEVDSVASLGVRLPLTIVTSVGMLRSARAAPP